MSDITALIEPPFNEHAGWLELSLLAGNGALIYAAVMVSSVAATAGLIVAAVLVFAVIGAIGIGDNSTSHDVIAYQKPGTTLAVRLHR
jgi:hypothetical protein